MQMINLQVLKVLVLKSWALLGSCWALILDPWFLKGSGSDKLIQFGGQGLDKYLTMMQKAQVH